jgi:hypothetical protein
LIRLVSERRHARVEEALRSEAAASLTTYELTIGGEDYTGRIDEVVIDASDVALLVDVTLDGKLPDSAQGRTVSLDVLIDDVPVRRFTGRALRPERHALYTDLRGASAGYWLERVKLNEKLSFSGRAPELICYEMLHRVPAYEFGLVRVDPLPVPAIKRESTLGEGFEPSASVMDVLEAVNAEVEIDARDTTRGGHRVRRKPTLEEAASPVWEFVVGRDIDPENFSHEREEDEYHDVAVYRATDSGDEELARVAVPDSLAPKGATLYHQISDESASAHTNARQTAYDLASRLKYGRHKFSATLEFAHVLLERGDPIAFRERTDEGETVWIALVGEYKEHYPARRMELGGRMVVLSREEAEPEEEEAPEPSLALATPPLGYDWLTRPYVFTSLSWVSVDGTTGDVLFDVDGAAAEGVSIYEENGEVVISG